MGTAITMFIAFVFLTTWIPPKWKRRAVGYGLASDITVHFVLQTMFGGDANGRAGLLLAGVLINACMHAYRRYFGYELLNKRGQWERFAGIRTDPRDMPGYRAPRVRKAKTTTKPARATQVRKTQAQKRSVH